MAAQRSIVICGGAFAGLALALAFRQGLGADIPVIVADPAKSRHLFVDVLGLPLQPAQPGDEYFFTEKVDGCKHFGIWPLAFVCFVPLLWALRDATPRRALWLGAWMGFVTHLGGYTWIMHVLQVFANAPLPLAFAGYLVLCAVQGLLFGVMSYVLVWMGRRTHWPAAALLPIALVATEFGYPLLFQSYTGIALMPVLPLVQIASITGVYGVSFLVVWFSVSLAFAFLRVVRQPGLRTGWLVELHPSLIVLLGITAFGVHRLRQPTEVDRELNVALIQPSIPQLLIWDHTEDANRFNKIMDLSNLALAAKPDLLIWPESSMPNFTENNFRAITNLIATHKVWMILGADDAERRASATDPGDANYFNAAFLFDPDGRFVATYRKQHLVVFGEYLPFARALPFLRRIIPVPGDFTPGNKAVSFELSGLRARLSPLICFEDVIPHLTRQSAVDGTDLLLNLTNDGWFGQSAAQWQQAANAVFRAVENGLPMVRCTNNGLTCWIDSRGRLRQIVQSESGDVYAPGFLIAKIPLLPAGQKPEPTFYHEHGDWFGWGCVGLSLVAVVARVLRQKAQAYSANRPNSA